jgi:hypothetical protein
MIPDERQLGSTEKQHRHQQESFRSSNPGQFISFTLTFSSIRRFGLFSDYQMLSQLPTVIAKQKMLFIASSAS